MKKVSMRVLMEAMKKLEKEAYGDFVPKLGKSWSMKVGDFDKIAKHHEKDDELDDIFDEPNPVGEPTKSMRKPNPEDEFIKSLKVAAENLDFGDDTETVNYDLDDTEVDSASTTDIVARFIDTAADSLADKLSKEKPEFQRMAPDQMEARLKDELMTVLKDMDNTDLFDRD